MAVTLKEVARVSGYNLSTVSLVLNNHPNAEKFKAATKAKIHATVAKLGYKPNMAARALVMQKVNNIGLVIPDHVQWQWKNPFYAASLNGVNQACQKLQFNVMTFCCNMADINKFVFPHGISKGTIGGVLLCGTISSEIAEQFNSLNLPFARLGVAGQEQECLPVFSPDYSQGMMLALEYLARLGHRQIAVMSTASPVSQAIAEKISRKVAESHLAVSIKNMFTQDLKCDAESAKQFIREYFNLPENKRPSAVITTPQTCLGLIKEMTRYNLNCPADISLISTHDFEVFDYINPGITSLSFDNETIACYATEKIIQKINNGDNDPLRSKIDFPVSLNIRNSCQSLQAGV